MDDDLAIEREPEGEGRTEKYQIAVRMSPELHSLLKECAFMEDRSMAMTARRAIARYITQSEAARLSGSPQS